MILSLPKQSARKHAGPIHRARPIKADESQTATSGFDSVDETTLFALGRLTLVKHDAVARLQSTFQFKRHSRRRHIDHRTQESTAFLTEAGVHQLLVIDAAKPSRMKTARKSHLHGIVLFLTYLLRSQIGIGAPLKCIPGGINGPSIGLGNRGHIFRRLEAPFNFQRTDTGANQIRDNFDAREILR